MTLSMLVRFERFVIERERIYTKRSLGLTAPWTKDKILQTYRFCNVHREDDAVTQWLTKNWREPNRYDPNLWFAMMVARHINRPESLEQMGYCSPWDTKRYYNMIYERESKGLKIYNAAYMVVPRATKAPKSKYFEEYIYTPMWKKRESIRPTKEDTLQSFFDRLKDNLGMGTFMTAQVIADIKYVLPLKNAKDWYTFVASGPGSRRGMNRLHRREVRMQISEAQWKEELLALQRKCAIKLHAQDLQNCLCEFDKYERARLGQGVPKQLYRGGKQ